MFSLVFKHILVAVIAVGVLSSCSRTQFGVVDQGSIKFNETEIYANFFKIESSTTSYEQPQLESNETQLAFRVTMPDGTNVSGLETGDFSIIENSVPVNNFLVQSQSTTTKQNVDIIFAVDITGSMSPTIESAKTRLISFVQNSRAKGNHTRMCLITFGDRTVKNCDRFYDNNPADPTTQSQVDELISEISKLKALTGISDPGGSDLHENPMRALIDASKAPWTDKSQRFVILITDDGFLYSPGNQGDVGSLAPRYSEVANAISTSQMKVFAATPSRAGYNRPFQGSPGVVEASQGEWFNFNDLIAGTITLDTILDRIMNRVQTTYLANYAIDENSGIDPTLALGKRKIEILLKNGASATVSIVSTQSNLPDGRKPYPKKFKLADKNIRRDSVRIKVNGEWVNSGVRLTDKNEVEFDKAPPARAKVEFSFSYKDLKDSVQIAPIILKDANLDPESIRVILNGIDALPGDIELAKTLEGFISVRLSDSVLSANDPYSIVSNGGLIVQVAKK
ncbi:MAG: hypothetical protein A2622_05835 [Bdellovibrionales bacterium RIFCSPHIGHO2_01_FULL_40_29]|nr:MAG: hypothetical protein A2622_05835 [Bdellovibrionales bacterium RIFCSPHIGHO2_01_FULL_40_29]OFZ34973.1 MAG: hypothetical protein A3D17_06185 [Bdellovibrionales bacterium RIFCSPHIGHO2_02_FULL_40_15]